MNNDDASATNEPTDFVQDPATGLKFWQSADGLPTPAGVTPTFPPQSGPAPMAPVPVVSQPRPGYTVGQTSIAAPYAIPVPAYGDLPAHRERRRTNRRPLVWQVGLIALVACVLVGLLIFGLNQRSSAGKWRSSSNAQQARANSLDGQLTTKTQQLTASQQKVTQLNNNLATLASEKAQITDQREQLRQIVSTVPSVTGGLRQCATSALTMAQDSLDYAASFPYGSIDSINADSDTITSVCGSASTAANTLDGLVNGITG
jgi:Tfp pilus assembly protein PilN